LTLGQLEWRAVELSGEFTPLLRQNMKKWYGMMGTKPCKLMEQLLEPQTDHLVQCAGKRKGPEGDTRR
jgi:hypothetical protein